MWYLCGMGSNIDPADNIPRALARLSQTFGALRVSEIIHTPPYGMTSANSFLNALVMFETDHTQPQLKGWLNQLETGLGRDRDHPESSTRDRPMDIDILAVREQPCFADVTLAEPYFRQLLAGAPEPGACRRVVFADRWLGEAPATIHWDERAGHIVVIHQRQQLHDHALEAAFPG
ncbi:MAG: 2-amino-4-hydroxy-6-hydroxymethyldihydropteridine diphosphokinase [Marinobacter sp.]|nr:2-amino-4-hydroxy-6-hydroxymethyldihydropteridine diphosphokinase [Marinobacter sp.]